MMQSLKIFKNKVLLKKIYVFLVERFTQHEEETELLHPLIESHSDCNSRSEAWSFVWVSQAERDQALGLLPLFPRHVVRELDWRWSGWDLSQCT